MKVEMYTADWCVYCKRAKSLLNARGITEIKEIDIKGDRTVVFERTGRLSIPQILIDDKLIGGYDDLVAFDKAGNLNPAK